MTDKDSSPHLAALRELELALDAHRRTQAAAGAFPRADAAKGPRRGAWMSRLWGPRQPGWRLPFNPGFMLDREHPVLRRTTITVIAVAALLLVGGGALWWRLASGPIMLDLATPWLTSAIEQNLGSRYRVEVGGTQRGHIVDEPTERMFATGIAQDCGELSFTGHVCFVEFHNVLLGRRDAVDADDMAAAPR